MSDTARYIMTLADVKDTETSWVKITTITMISKFSEHFDITLLKKRMGAIGPVCLCKKPKQPIESKPIMGKTQYGKSARIGVMHAFEWTMKKTGFYNQVSLVYFDQFSTKSAKIFPNGSIQVAGCSSLSDCHRVLYQLTLLLKTVLQIDKVTCQEPRVVMINTNFSLNYNINLMEATRIFGSSKKFSSVTFDPDRYSAVKIKFQPGQDMKQVTVSIFSTGKTIITGAETLKEIVFAYKAITEHVNLHAAQIKVEPTEVKDTFDYIEGWKITDAISFFRSIGIKPFEEPVQPVPASQKPEPVMSEQELIRRVEDMFMEVGYPVKQSWATESIEAWFADLALAEQERIFAKRREELQDQYMSDEEYRKIQIMANESVLEKQMRVANDEYLDAWRKRRFITDQQRVEDMLIAHRRQELQGEYLTEADFRNIRKEARILVRSS